MDRKLWNGLYVTRTFWNFLRPLYILNTLQRIILYLHLFQKCAIARLSCELLVYIDIVCKLNPVLHHQETESKYVE